MSARPVRSARDASAYQAARSHTRRVRWLKLALPALSVLGLAVILVRSFLIPALDTVEINDIVLSEEGLTMMSPRLSGADGQNRPYEVTAERATQSLENPDIVNLETIDARLALGEDGWARVDAARGRFDSTSRQLELYEDVLVRSSTGYEMRLQGASVDMAGGGLVSQTPVSIEGPTSTLAAESLEMTDNGAVVTFRGRVRMTIRSSETPQSQPPSGEGNRQ